MKRLISLLLCLILLLISGVSSAEGEIPAVLPTWLELSADDTVLTVRIPLENANAQSCRFLISDERFLELLTCETIGDEKGEEGQNMWVGSFMSAFQESGHVFLQLSTLDSDGNPLAARMLCLFVREDHSIEIVSHDADSPFRLDEDQTGLNLRLRANPSTGYSWTYSLSEEGILRLVSEEYLPDPVKEPVSGSGGAWTARFAADGAAGFVDLTLRYARPWEEGPPADEFALHLFVNESGMIFPVVPQAADAAPVGLYEAEDGSTLGIFRKSDGTFSVELSICRLTAQDDGLGEYKDGALTFTATDASGNPMIWEITRAGEAVKAVVIDSTWALLEEGTEFEFLPAAG